MIAVERRHQEPPKGNVPSGDFTARQSIELGGPTPGGTYEAKLPLTGPGYNTTYPILIRRIRARKASGTCTTFQPQVLSEALGNVAYTNQIVSEHIAPTTVAVADLYDSGTIDVPTTVYPDADGQCSLYFRGNPDAGTDNVFEVILDYEG